MDVYAAVESYMKRVFSDIHGMKILLVDRETVNEGGEGGLISTFATVGHD
jgi:hypothetical protein